MCKKNDHLKKKSKFLCIQSLVLEVKGLKQKVYIFKNRSFISVLSYLKGTATLMITTIYMKDLNKP